MWLRSNQGRKSLPDALRTYWWALSGLAIFPFCLLVGAQVYGVPFPYFMPLFFAAVFLSIWPWLKGEVPYSFNLVAGAVWLGGAILGVCFASLVRAFLS